MALRRALSIVRSQRILVQFSRTPLCTCHGSASRSWSPAAAASINFLPHSSQPICRKYSRHGVSNSMRDGGREPQQQRKFFPRRAVMYVPASDERKTKKATTLSVDTLVFDLEDGVAANQKEKARQHVQQAILNCRSSSDLPGSRSEHVVRINSFESGMLHDDLEAVFYDPSGKCEEVDEVNGFPHAIMLPKCDSVEQLSELDIALAFHRREPDPFTPVKLIIIIESPIGLINLKEICQFGTSSAKHFTLVAVTFGSDDFLARLGGANTKDARELIFARQSLVTHAKAFGLDAIDLVDTNFKDLEGLKRVSEEGARMGYTGKQVIHPNQVPVVRQAFSPSPERVKWATGLIEAFHKHQKSGKGAFEYEGQSIDRPLLLQAENVVRLQEAISV